MPRCLSPKLKRNEYAGAPPDALAIAVQTRVVRWLYGNLPVTIVAVAMNHLTMAALALTTEAPLWAVIGFGVIATAVMLIRTGMLLAYRHRFDADAPGQGWTWLYAATSILSGVAVGGGTVLFVDLDYPAASLLIVFLTTGLCGASLASNAGHLPTTLGFLALAICGLAVAILREAGAYGPIGAVAVICYGLILARAVLAYQQQFVDASRKSVEKAQLAQRLQQALQAAEAANEAKSRFLMAMSHELRTPLNAVIGFSDVIRQQISGPVGNPAYIDYAEDIHASGQHLLSLVDDLLDIGRIEAGTVELREEEIALDPLLDSVAVMVAPRLDAAKQRLTLQRLPHALYADRRRVQQMLLNLLTNASKFSPPGTEITLAAAQDGMELVLSVTDRGIGIPQENLDRVTEPFVQLSDGTDRLNEGVGMGLALVKGWIDQHQGGLLIESGSSGTCVQLRFPPERLRLYVEETDVMRQAATG